MVAAFMQQQVGDQLAPAVPHRRTIDVNWVLFVQVGVGPCLEMELEGVASAAPLSVDLGPGQEVSGRELWHGSGLEVDNGRNPAVIREDDMSEAVAKRGPAGAGGQGLDGLVVRDRRLDLMPRPTRVGEEVLQRRLVHRVTVGGETDVEHFAEAHNALDTKGGSDDAVDKRAARKGPKSGRGAERVVPARRHAAKTGDRVGRSSRRRPVHPVRYRARWSLVP